MAEHAEKNFLDKIKDQLDKDAPNWYLEWANASQFQMWAQEARRHGLDDADRRLKNRHHWMLNRVLSAAIRAGVVTEVEHG